MFTMIQIISQILKILKTPIRLKILFLLKDKEKTYTELLSETTDDSGRLAFHLRKMKDFVATEEGFYKLTPIGRKLCDYIEGLGGIVSVLFVKVKIDVFVQEDGRAKIFLKNEYTSPVKATIVEFFSYFYPAKKFIEEFLTEKMQKLFKSPANFKILKIKAEDRCVKAKVEVDVERYANKKNGVWIIDYHPGKLISEMVSETDEFPWSVELRINITINLPEKVSILKVDDFEMKILGEGFEFFAEKKVEKNCVKGFVMLRWEKDCFGYIEDLKKIRIHIEYETEEKVLEMME
ncbi:MAG: winged helix-turn-helix domain-containing protein [Candidatus Methanofastidiosia archaeon]